MENRLNILDLLQYESANGVISEGMKELTSISSEISMLCRKGEKLNTESGLVGYLLEEGYDVTTETASTVAKDIWENIKKAIKWLIDKFMVVFNKIKNYLFGSSTKIKNILEALKKEVEKISTKANPELLDNSSFATKFPTNADFNKKETLENIIKIIKDSVENMGVIDSQDFFDTTLRVNGLSNELKDLVSGNKNGAIIGVLHFKPKISVLINNYKSKKLEIKTFDINGNYNTNHKEVIEKGLISSLITESLSVNDYYERFLKDVEKIVKNLNNFKIDNKSEYYKPENIQHNVSVSIEACRTILNNYDVMMRDFIFILAQNVKCYK